jgi:AcrR family transcriptional regulator
VSVGEIVQGAERPQGRPRSERADRAILDAAIDLFIEQGYEAMSIEGVAARAGVGKTTIYRRWASKEDLIVAAIDEVIFDVEPTDSGSVREDLIGTMTRIQTIFTSSNAGPLFGRMMPHLVAGSPLGRAYLERVIGPRFAMLQGVIAAAIERGELRADVDPEMVRALLVGPVVVWMLTHRLTRKGIKKRAEGIVDTILPGLVVPSRRGR